MKKRTKPRQAFWPIRLAWANYNYFKFGPSLVHGIPVNGEYVKTFYISFARLRVYIGPTFKIDSINRKFWPITFRVSTFNHFQIIPAPVRGKGKDGKYFTGYYISFGKSRVYFGVPK